MPAGLHYHPTTSEFVYAAGGTIVVCDSKDPHNQVFLRGHDSNISCLTMSKTGRYLASGQYGENADVLVWDFESKKLLYRFAEHDFGIQCLAFSDDEMLLSTVGDGMEDKRMFIWDLRTGNIVTSTFASPAKTTCVTWGRFVKDIKRRETSSYQLATGGEKGVVLWALDPYTGEVEQSKVQQQQTRDFTCLRFSTDCNTLFAGTTSGDFVAMNVRNKNSEGSVAASNTGVHAIEYFDDEDGAHVIAGGGDGTVSQFVKNGTEWIEENRAQLPGGVYALSLSPDALEVIAGTMQGFIYRLRPGALSPLLVCENHFAGVVAVAYENTVSDQFATISLDGTIRIWDAGDYTVLCKMVVKDALRPTCLAFSLDAVISGWEDGRIRAHHPTTGEMLWIIDDAHRDGVTACALSGNERFVMTGGAQGEVRIWEMRTRELVTHLKEHTSRVTSLCMFDDDAHALSCSRDRSFLCWDLRRERRISNHTQRMGGVNAITLSKDQTQVLTVGQEKKVTYWDLRESTPLKVLDYSRAELGGNIAPMIPPGVNVLEATSEAMCIAVSNSGSVFATGGTDHMVKFWDFQTGELLMDGVGHSGTVRSLNFSPDDRQLISVGDDGCIFIWNCY
jgi:WD40 repeat protein